MRYEARPCGVSNTFESCPITLRTFKNTTQEQAIKPIKRIENSILLVSFIGHHPNVFDTTWACFIRQTRFIACSVGVLPVSWLILLVLVPFYVLSYYTAGTLASTTSASRGTKSLPRRPVSRGYGTTGRVWRLCTEKKAGDRNPRQINPRLYLRG